MVKLVDTPDLGSGAARRVGSSPIRRTSKKQTVSRILETVCFLYPVTYILLPFNMLVHKPDQVIGHIFLFCNRRMSRAFFKWKEMGIDF